VTEKSKEYKVRINVGTVDLRKKVILPDKDSEFQEQIRVHRTEKNKNRERPDADLRHAVSNI